MKREKEQKINIKQRKERKMQNTSQALRGSPKNRLPSLMLWKNDCYTSAEEVRKLNFMCPAWKKKKSLAEKQNPSWPGGNFEHINFVKKKNPMVKLTTIQGTMQIF